MRWRWITMILACVCLHLSFCLLYDAIPWKQRGGFAESSII